MTEQNATNMCTSCSALPKLHPWPRLLQVDEREEGLQICLTPLRGPPLLRPSPTPFPEKGVVFIILMSGFFKKSLSHFCM